MTAPIGAPPLARLADASKQAETAVIGFADLALEGLMGRADALEQIKKSMYVLQAERHLVEADQAAIDGLVAARRGELIRTTFTAPAPSEDTWRAAFEKELCRSAALVRENAELRAQLAAAESKERVGL